MLLLPRMTGGGGFIGDIPRGGLGEEAATLDRLTTLLWRASLNPVCSTFIVKDCQRKQLKCHPQWAID
jgi:hypothetical protein